jgi:hypothetical protein
MSGYGIVSNMAQYLCTLALEKLMRMLRGPSEASASTCTTFLRPKNISIWQYFRSKIMILDLPMSDYSSGVVRIFGWSPPIWKSGR